MCHVLIIEDEWLIAEHIEQIARDAGATSIMAADCEADAVEAANSRTPEIILSDVNLLTGTGPCAVATILATLGQIPVIFITGTRQDCVPCGSAAVILDKPIKPQLLTETFRRMAPLG